MLPLKILWALVKISLCAGLAGGVVDMTRAMISKAATAHRTELVKLADLNGCCSGPSCGNIGHRNLNFTRKLFPSP